LGTVVEDCVAAGYSGTLAGLDLDVVLGFLGVGESGQEDVVALACAELEVGGVERLGVGSGIC
jgi:hypothetical protein